MSNHSAKIQGGWWRGYFRVICPTCGLIAKTSTRPEATRVKRDHHVTHRKDPK